MGAVEKHDKKTLVCDEDSFQAAIILCKNLLEHTRFVFAHLPSAAEISPKLRTFYDSLPKQFDRKDFHAAAAKLGIVPKTSDRYIRKLVRLHWLVHDFNDYRKVDIGISAQ